MPKPGERMPYELTWREEARLTELSTRRAKIAVLARELANGWASDEETRADIVSSLLAFADWLVREASA